MNRVIILLVCLFAGFTAGAQTIEATTATGKKVILSPDGTWKYAGDEKQKPGEKPEEPKKEKKTPTPVTGTMPADCEELLEVTDDTRTGLRITRSKSRMIADETGGKTQLGIAVQKNSKQIITLLLYPIGSGNCIGEGNKVDIEFTDGSKMELSHDGFANCNGESSINFGGNYGKKKQLELLKTKKIKKIKAWTQQGSVQQTLPADIQEKLLKLFNCLAYQ